MLSVAADDKRSSAKGLRILQRQEYVSGGVLEVSTTTGAYHLQKTSLRVNVSDGPLTDAGKALAHSDPGLWACFAVSTLSEMVGNDFSQTCQF